MGGHDGRRCASVPRRSLLTPFPFRVFINRSIGLDRPMWSILADIKAALGPAGLPSWNLQPTSVQPCPTWTGQQTGRPTTGQTLAGIVCRDTTAPVGLMRLVYGGISTLLLPNTVLNGTLPTQLRELRTTTSIDLTCVV